MKKVYLIATLFVSVTAFAQKDNVGIGTTKPDQSAALEISSSNKGLLTPRMSLQQRSSIQNPAIGLIVYQTDLLSGFYFFDGKEWKSMTSETNANSIADANNWGLGGNTLSGGEYVGTTNDMPLIFRINTVNNTQYNEKMRLTSVGLGIGVAPTEALHVGGNILSTGFITGNLVNASARTYIKGKDGAGFHWFASSPTVPEPNNIMMGIRSDPTTSFVTDLFLSPGGNFALSIANTGKVRVGDITTPGDYNLFVKGGIMTEKIKVAVLNSADWADYVFEDDYKVLSLEQVEKFIKENKHLPNVPSTAEVLANGVDVAKTDAKLLEKIEELTLYMIALNKEIKAIKEENNNLKSLLK